VLKGGHHSESERAKERGRGTGVREVETTEGSAEERNE
jgi:hypothetical protein